MIIAEWIFVKSKKSSSWALKLPAEDDFHLMMSGAKVIIHGKLACQWVNDFMTRPNMRVYAKLWGVASYAD